MADEAKLTKPQRRLQTSVEWLAQGKSQLEI